MSSTPAAITPPAQPWTCPFCALLCDGFELAADADRHTLRGSDCPRALAALQRCGTAAAPVASARLGAQALSTEAAIEQAARWLAVSRQPLFGGLGTDVDGARALYPLACATGAICDPAGGDLLMHGLRSLQDRGAFTTTLAEVRNRADLIVCLGGSPREGFPEVWRRFGLGEALVAQREVVFVGAPVDAALSGLPRTAATSVALQGDLFDTAALLAACVAGRRVSAAPAIAALAERLRAARYAVIVWEAGRLPAQGTLIVEAVNALVATLNRHTRAAALPLAGNDGLTTVNQVFAWLSGLPLRSRAGPLGLEHEPQRFDTARLLAGGSVDALLWLASFGTEAPPPATGLPSVVIGHPATEVPEGALFIPVATPGVGAPGHLFRNDGVVALALEPVRQDVLPTAASVLQTLARRVTALKRGAA